jgi:hypothetical protein
MDGRVALEESGIMKQLRRGSSTKSVLGGVAAAMAVTAFCPLALADGGIPHAYGILFEPGNPDHIVARSLFWGVFDKRAGATSASFYCSEAYGGMALNSEDNPTVIAKGGRILVAASFGGLVITDDGCAWHPVESFGMDLMAAVAPVDAEGTKFVTVSSTGRNGTVATDIYLTADRGDTWTEVKGKIADGYSFNTVAVAPSDPKRIYLAGVLTDSSNGTLAASADGGDTWTLTPIPITDKFDHLQIAGIDPTNADAFFIRADGANSTTPPEADTLWATKDAGKTWVRTYAVTIDPAENTSFTSIGDLPGFALSADGKKVFIAGPTEGIKSAATADALAGKPDAFTSVFTGQVWGLAYRDGKLYAGNDDFSGNDRFMVGVSSDDGSTFTQVLDHCNVAFPTCPASSTMEVDCRVQWERQGGYVTDFLQMGSCVQSGSEGTAGAAGSSSGAGGVTASGGTAGSLPSGAAGTSGTGGAPSGGASSGAAPNETAPDAGNSPSKGCSVSPSKSDSGMLAALFAAAVLGLQRSRKRRY